MLNININFFKRDEKKRLRNTDLTHRSLASCFNKVEKYWSNTYYRSMANCFSKGGDHWSNIYYRTLVSCCNMQHYVYFRWLCCCCDSHTPKLCSWWLLFPLVAFAAKYSWTKWVQELCDIFFKSYMLCAVLILIV